MKTKNATITIMIVNWKGSYESLSWAIEAMLKNSAVQLEVENLIINPGPAE